MVTPGLTPPDAASAAAAVAYAAGARTVDVLRLAVAIAGGESGWRPDAVGDVSLADDKWGPSIGLWQIRSLRAQTGTGQSRDANRLPDPAFNARSMWEISGGGQSWGPWSVYTSGAYRQHLDVAGSAARWAIGAMGDPGQADVVLRGVTAGGVLADAAGATASLLPGFGGLAIGSGFVIRGALLSGGALLATVGLWTLLRPDLSALIGSGA